MQIPFHKPYITDDEINAAVDSIRNGWLTMGKKTFEFEGLLNHYLGTGDAVAVNSCTAALHLALICIGLQPGDEVIIPTTTFIATAEVIRYFNAIPVMIDIERDTHLINVSKIEAKITNKTKAIIPVHFSGQPADMDEIMEIAKANKLYVIEDAAHSLPAKYKDRFIGTIGDFTCFSFYATKTLTTGEGGLITTNNNEWADKIRMLRLHGISKDAWKRYSKEGSWEYDVIHMGYKYNISDINSAIGIEQFKKIDSMNDTRKNIAEKYIDSLKECEGIFLYKVKQDRKSSWHLFPIKLNLEYLNINRNQFIIELEKMGISTSVHFIPLYRFSYYTEMGYNSKNYPDSEWVFDRTISLPIYPGMEDNEIDYVIDNVLNIVKKSKT